MEFTGFKAGFSHAPNMDGKERYVFFSFPHIGICSEGEVGQIHRPGRSGASSACGALIGALGQFQADKSVMTAYSGGQHDVQDPEFSILKQRLAMRIKQEGLDVNKMNLVDMTALAERTITADLEGLIKETVDPMQQDYAVVTGVHVHNWGNEGTGAPDLEWIAPSSVYVVNNGKKININLEVCPSVPSKQSVLPYPPAYWLAGACACCCAVDPPGPPVSMTRLTFNAAVAPSSSHHHVHRKVLFWCRLSQL
jgi:hypothetical protein